MSGDATERETGRGGDHFVTALKLAVAAWLGCALLQVLLYARPAPNGGPFLVEWTRYFGLALYYDLLGVWLLTLPFFLLWLILYRRPLRPAGWRLVNFVLATLLAANLLLSALDHEVMRFLGVRLNGSFILAYFQPRMLADPLFIDLLRSDRGGPFLSLVLILTIPALYLWWSVRTLRRRGRGLPAFAVALLLVVIPIAAPANAWRMATSQFRLRKVEPVVLAFVTDAAAGYDDAETPADMDRLVAEYRRDWQAGSADSGWRFPDPRYPYYRVPVGAPPPPTAERWNVIYLQLETLRGADTGFLRPDLPRSPTPFLDRLANGPNAAVWTRALSFGMPSINGLFASHCSVAPHSRLYITMLTRTRFLCLPELLRRRGYRTEMFNGGDTDWDNSSPWLRQWYHRLWRFPAAQGRDRDIFREAAAGLRRLGRSGRPFMATVVSVTNHTPFILPGPGRASSAGSTPAERILETTRYTDDAVRELLDGLAGEPWMRRTLIVIAGDHGFNVGEHGQVAGQHNLYRESLWVPLIVAGPHPRLPVGRHDDLAALVDIAPTLADLLGIREANPWQGHSLLASSGRGLVTFGFRESRVADTGSWSAVRDPRDGAARLYRSGDDWLQRRDLARAEPALARALLERAERARRLNDFLLRQARIWPTNPS